MISGWIRIVFSFLLGSFVFLFFFFLLPLLVMNEESGTNDARAAILETTIMRAKRS